MSSLRSEDIEDWEIEEFYSHFRSWRGVTLFVVAMAILWGQSTHLSQSRLRKEKIEKCSAKRRRQVGRKQRRRKSQWSPLDRRKHNSEQLFTSAKNFNNVMGTTVPRRRIHNRCETPTEFYISHANEDGRLASNTLDRHSAALLEPNSENTFPKNPSGDIRRDSKSFAKDDDHPTSEGVSKSAFRGMWSREPPLRALDKNSPYAKSSPIQTDAPVLSRKFSGNDMREKVPSPMSDVSISRPTNGTPSGYFSAMGAEPEVAEVRGSSDIAHTENRRTMGDLNSDVYVGSEPHSSVIEADTIRSQLNAIHNRTERAALTEAGQLPASWSRPAPSPVEIIDTHPSHFDTLTRTSKGSDRSDSDGDDSAVKNTAVSSQSINQMELLRGSDTTFESYRTRRNVGRNQGVGNREEDRPSFSAPSSRHSILPKKGSKRREERPQGGGAVGVMVDQESQSFVAAEAKNELIQTSKSEMNRTVDLSKEFHMQNSEQLSRMEERAEESYPHETNTPSKSGFIPWNTDTWVRPPASSETEERVSPPASSETEECTIS